MTQATPSPAPVSSKSLILEFYFFSCAILQCLNNMLHISKFFVYFMLILIIVPCKQFYVLESTYLGLRFFILMVSALASSIRLRWSHFYCNWLISWLSWIPLCTIFSASDNSWMKISGKL